MCPFHSFGWGGGGWGAPFGGMLGGGVMLLFWVALIALGVFAVWALARRSSPQGALPGGGSTAAGSQALEILKERYAKGELSKEQYEEMRRYLT